MRQLRFVVFGLSITSSWGNGHATTYRGLVRELVARGHDVLFLERDVPWYADNRDLPQPPYGRTVLYNSVEEAKDRFARHVRQADVVMVGSYVPDGIAMGEWVVSQANGVTAFYDIDTPVTLAKLERGEEEYLSTQLVSRYDLYLSFTGGPILRRLVRRFGAQKAHALYCSVDPAMYRPEPRDCRWDLGYIGTYGEDRQPTLDDLLSKPARQWKEGRFVVAGPMYPKEISWPQNVQRVDHLAPSDHRAFYNSQRFTLNVTRADMVRAGHSPSVRLFEAAACGVPIISDWWAGLDRIFKPGREILISRSPEDSLRFLRELPDEDRRLIGERARARVLAYHTAAHRAAELEQYVTEAITVRAASRSPQRVAPRHWQTSR
jgi:spore maturation protein CgeB